MSFAKHLPPGWAIRRAHLHDTQHVSGLLRPVDRDELEALEGRPVQEVLASAIEGHGFSVARVLTIRAEPMVLYGVTACEGLPGNAMPWRATVASLDTDELSTIMWMSRLQLDVWQHRWPTLQAVCDTRNLFHRQWLEWLGFTARSHLDSFGAGGRPFDLYVRGGAP